MQRYKQPHMDVHPDGEWVRYADHCEAMKRIAAPSASAQQAPVAFNEDAERKEFEDAIRSLTDPANHHDNLARDEYAHGGYAQWPVALAWECWKKSRIDAPALGVVGGSQ